MAPAHQHRATPEGVAVVDACPCSDTVDMYECSESGCQACYAAEGPHAPSAGAAYGSPPGSLVDRYPSDPVWEVIMTSIDESRRIEIVRVLREVTDFGLKDAFDFVSDLPRRVMHEVTKMEAEHTAEKLRECGAQTRVQ